MRSCLLKSTIKDTEADNPIIRLVSGLHQLRTTFLNFLLLPCFPGGQIFIRDALTSAFQSSLIPLNTHSSQGTGRQISPWNSLSHRFILVFFAPLMCYSDVNAEMCGVVCYLYTSVHRPVIKKNKKNSVDSTAVDHLANISRRESGLRTDLDSVMLFKGRHVFYVKRHLSCVPGTAVITVYCAGVYSVGKLPEY